MSYDLTGRCLCGAVSFTGTRSGEGLRACHCSQCRRWSGHFGSSVEARDVRIAGAVTWYRSSVKSERGFCPTCGSSLFFRDVGRDDLDVAMGSLDAPTGMRMTGHIYVADKGDYYDIADGLPQWPGSTADR